jgi:hypothetical protein
VLATEQATMPGARELNHGTTATGLHASCRSRGSENRDVRAFRGRRVCEISLFPPEEKAGRGRRREKKPRGEREKSAPFCKYLDRDY